MKTRALNSDQGGGIVLIASAVTTLAGAAVANFTLARSQRSFGGTPEEILVARAAHPSASQPADVLIVVPISLTALGIVPITLGYGEPGLARAWVGLLTFSISSVLGATQHIVRIYLEPWVAVEGVDLDNITMEPFSRFGEVLGEWFTLMAFTALALYGMAWLRRQESSSIGWLFVGGWCSWGDAPAGGRRYCGGYLHGDRRHRCCHAYSRKVLGLQPRMNCQRCTAFSQ